MKFNYIFLSILMCSAFSCLYSMEKKTSQMIRMNVAYGSCCYSVPCEYGWTVERFKQEAAKVIDKVIKDCREEHEADSDHEADKVIKDYFKEQRAAFVEKQKAANLIGDCELDLWMGGQFIPNKATIEQYWGSIEKVCITKKRDDKKLDYSWEDKEESD